MAKYTPMMEQYLAIKAEAQDCLLFFRLGDFYEMFFDDAELASRELEITLTGRDAGQEARIPMCGVPYHAAEGYIARLIEKGYKVAICEQVENPAEAKGVVRREIVRIVTPGTAMDGRSVKEGQNNFIVSVCRTADPTEAEDRGGNAADDMGNETAGGFAAVPAAGRGMERYALAACDLTTGELHAAVITGDIARLSDEISLYLPSEIIAEAELLEGLRVAVQGWNRPVLFTPRPRDGGEALRRQFPDEHLRACGPERLPAVAMLLSYLNETQRRALQHITRISCYEPEQYLVVDPFTRRNLELTETVRDRSRKGSLLWLLDRTVTAMGGRLLRRWIDKPLRDRAKIERRLDAVQHLYDHYLLREELRGSLKRVYDLERLAGRIAYGNANARDMLALRRSLEEIPAIVNLLRDTPSEALREELDRIDDCADICGWIAAAIADDPPVGVRDGGLIRSGYHARLDELREASVGGKRWIAELERSERERTGIKSLKVGFNKVFGYYLEVTKANLSMLEDGRYERKQTLANAERFVTPELKEKEALILEAEEKIGDLEYELFLNLRERIAAETERLQRLSGIVAVLDSYQSLAEVAASNRFNRPVLTDGYGLRIAEGRHPVVEAVMQGDPFMANSAALTRDGPRMMLITGPNMAGKSTYMRQVALIALMAHIGSFVPAGQAEIPLIDRIFTRIGAADDLIGGQSTFMVEMKDIQVMTAQATEKSLVIIDELGRGTSTAEGMAIAQAVIEFIHERIRCKTLVSTHFHELAHLETSLAYLANYSMAVEERDDQVIFLRKLESGAADTSYGIYCAQIAGLPDPVIERAYDLLHGYEARTTGAEQAAAGLEQLSLFGEPESYPSRPLQTKEPIDSRAKPASDARPKPGRTEEAKPSPSLGDQLVETVRQADLMNMTPLMAMQFIQDLKNKIQRE